MARKTPSSGSGGKCTCNTGMGILASLVMAIGILLGVQGLAMQLDAKGAWADSTAWILGYYFVGVLLVGTGKIMKKGATGCCAAHGMCGCKQ